MNKYLRIHSSISYAVKHNFPVVALESTVITHGLPYPENEQLALAVEEEIRSLGAVPATIALLDGFIHIGLDQEQIHVLANPDPSVEKRKVSRKDFGVSLVKGIVGGTTVAATMAVANMVNIRVFATGGIGGVHRGHPMDISADLPELSHTPVLVVCSGAKAILNLPDTLEFLETWGVPVIGFQTNELPAFYSRESGLPVDHNAQTPVEISRIASAHWALGMKSGVLVGNPPPPDVAIPADVVEGWITTALKEAEEQGVSRASVTPFLLARVSDLSGGKSMQTNIALLKNNARLAANIAKVLAAANLPFI
jgi:pseudouridine-5'-phosphate glycosidase